jgi:hypothetical protein
VTRMDDRTRDFLENHKACKGYVLPTNGKDGKEPDFEMIKRQRGTKNWKDHPDSFCERPATREEVKEWAAAEGVGIAAITGERSGLVALDIDFPRKELVEMLLCGVAPDTPAAKSPGGGGSFLFRFSPEFKHYEIRCPVFNEKTIPGTTEANTLYIGRSHLGAFQVGKYIVLPPGPGREWLPGRSPSEVEPAEVPDGLIDILEQIARRNKNQSNRRQRPIEHPCSIEQCSIGKEEPTVLLEQKTDRVTVLLEVSSSVVKLVTDKDSPLIPALVKKLGGKGLRVPCPYHPPDNNPSANFRYHDKEKSRGWYFEDYHCSPGEPAYSIPVSQLCADMETGYLERCANGGSSYRHRIYTLRKVRPEAFFWVALAAADLGLVDLPPSRFPAKLDGFTPEGERLMYFIDRWDRARRGAGCNDPIPLGRPWLIKVLCALPNPGMDKDKPKPPEWTAAFKKHDNAITRAVRQGLLERVAPGVGNKAALYRVVPPEERQAKQDGGNDSGED